MTATPRVFTIPPSVPFLPTLITALVEGRLVPGFAPGHDPLALASATIYLPTRRACRLARDSFLDVMKTDAALLPRIVAIGDIDEDEIAFLEAAAGEEVLDLPPALSGLTRRLLLTRLVLTWAERLKPAANGDQALVIGSPASALALADDLARVMDDMATREVPWERLDRLVPDHVDKYWQLTLDFLKIAREHWPGILNERGAIEPALRRDLLINAEAARLAAAPEAPVIAAGSTGSMPATAKLLATIAGLPRGAVVLPGLDTKLDDDAWRCIGRAPGASGDEMPASGHPQFAMHGLLSRIGLARSEVVTLGTAAPWGRELLVSEAMRPAPTTERWRARLTEDDFDQQISNALSEVAVIEAANVEDEAVAIAVALREVLETEDKTAALVTPDRALARRVVAALGRWSIEADDSGGDPLAATAPGVFARLAAECALGGAAPVPVLALLKHPLLRLGAPAGAHARAIAALEVAILRGPRPRQGSLGLQHALATFRTELAKLRDRERCDIHPSEPRAHLAETDLADAAELAERLVNALMPLEGIARSRAGFAAIAALHHATLERLGGDEAASMDVFAGQDGLALLNAFEDISAHAGGDADLPIDAGDYLEIFDAAIADRVVRRPGLPGARLRIYGPLEARLVSVDRVVLGGLTEGMWPPDPAPDPWLNRPMRHQLGLDLPERRIGLSAHDLTQLMGAREAILTRSAKVAGAPAVGSRFLQRLAAVAGPARWTELVARGARYLDFARSLDRPARVARIRQPEPRPPRAARPAALSVTDIEHWLRDPYTIYAKYILRLPRLDPVDVPLGAADRGSAIHGAIGEFAQAYADALPADAYRELIRIGRAHFAPLDDYPEARAFWWPRYERIARWLAAWERERRPGLAELYAETRGEIAINLGERSFRLSARADRIERRRDGSYALLDFKTGAPPSDKQVRIGIAPQLTLEAAILRGGGFDGVPAEASVAELVYVRLNGGEPAGDCCAVNLKEQSADMAADHALARLAELARRYEDETTPYRSLVLPMWQNRYGTYDDLARVKEWSQTGGADGGEE